jgi:replicative DNA helicase
MQRLVAAEAKVGVTGIRTGLFRRDRWQDITTAVARFAEAPLVINNASGNAAMSIRDTWYVFIDIVERLAHHKPKSIAAHSGEPPLPSKGNSALTVLNLRARSLEVRRRLRQDGKELGLIVVDPVQLLQDASQVEPRKEEHSEISRDLKGLACELDIPIIALSRLSRLVGPKVRTDTHPQMSDLREFGAFGENADLVLFVHRECPRPGSAAAIQEAVNLIPQWDAAKIIAEKPPIPEYDDAEIVVAKNPRGKAGTVKMKFEREYVTFSEIS